MEMHRRRFLGILGLGSLGAHWALGAGETGLGPGLVFQFDDGWPNWTEVIAPELKKAGGKATGFVCNQYVDSGRISVKQLRKLQDDSGWEIGSHCYHHLHAPRYVQKHGLDQWLKEELDASLKALRAMGLKVRSLAFPYNAFTPEVAAAAMKRVESFRRAEPIAVAPGIRTDGSVPGSAMDIAQYTPVNIIKPWIDFAARRGEVLFLYGHRVLSDDQFTSGTVAGLAGNSVTAKDPVNVPEGEEMVLVSNPTRRANEKSVMRVVSAKGRDIRCERVEEGALGIGDGFLMGPSYGTRLSDFRAILAHAKGKLPFYTLHEIARKSHTS
ncbi:polysaccharide deacetylase family protein [Verrucomicrobiota bacterium]